MAQKLTLAVGPEHHDLTVGRQPDGSFTMGAGEETHQVTLERIGESALHLLTVDGVAREVYISHGASGLEVFLGADLHAVHIHRAAGGGGDAEIEEGELPVRSPMTGAVVEVLVAAGDEVAKDDPLLVVVAMKMNNEIKAPVDATVKEVHVAVEDAVDQGDVLLVLEVGDGGGGDDDGAA